MFLINHHKEKAEHSSEGGLELNTKAKMKALVVGTAENNNQNPPLNGSPNGSSIKKGATVRCDGQRGVVENVILVRCRGDIRSEYQVRLSDGSRAYFLAENFAPPPTTRPLPTFLERLQKIAHSCDRRQGDNGALSQPGRAVGAL